MIITAINAKGGVGKTRTLSKQQSQSATSSFFRPVLLLPTSPEYGSCATQSTEHLMQSY